MTVAFQIQTGIRLAPAILDMRSQEHAFRRMVRAIWSKSKFMQGGKFVTCKQAWEFKPYITSLVPIIGHSRAGICRRPMLCNEVWMLIAKVSKRANLHGRCAATFGKHSKAGIPTNILCTWRSTATHSIHRLCEKSKKYKAAALSQEDATRNADSDCDHEEDTRSIRKVQDTGERCHFGHKTTTTRVRGKVVWNRNPACSW